jgi:hypothetical protein
MNFLNIKRTNIILILVLFGSSCFFFSSRKDKSKDGMIIITRVAGKMSNENFCNGDAWRYISKTQIALIDPSVGEGSLTVLTSDYFSAQAPVISYDAKNMLFAAQVKENDPWQIWEMNLGNLKAKQITTTKENCTDPAYLPNGRIIYSKQEVNDSLKANHSLYSCNIDGSDIKRVTFNPTAYFATNILKDGRILAIGRQAYPEMGDQMFMVLRPDGTKAEMFYNGAAESNLISCGRETSDGKIIFIESKDSTNKSGNLVSISYNRPLHSRVELATKGDFLSAFSETSQKMLVSYRKSNTERYSLYEFDIAKKSLGKKLYSDNEFDVLDAIVIAQKERPKKLPSEVDMEVKTGLLLCQDINITDNQTSTKKAAELKPFGIEVLGLDSSMGKVQVEADGSFYLRVLADKPFRIQTIDKDGKVLNGPGSWIWLRPNERRGCVGCHEYYELTPQNKVPLSVKNNPVIIPVHIDKIVEKSVLLE